MGGHHKKNLRAEKAKVKLKGAKLPKGLNLTKTDFKVRKIEIREQLKESRLTDAGQRQLNLKETLSRLKHHSVKFRIDAMRGVRDSVKSGQANHLIGHLNDLLQGIAAGALDVERDARHESFKTLDAVLEALEPQALTPFIHVLSTYLRCSMTHVLPAIQEDSMLMLDVLLERLPPQLLATRTANTIISNFVDMISRARNDNEKTNRTLTMRLGLGQQTTVKWRTKVLQRLQKILGTLIKPTAKSNARTRVEYFDSDKPQYYSLLRPLQFNIVDFRDMFEVSNAANAETTQLRTYVEQLVPLLQDNWLEVRPQQLKASNAGQKQKTLLTHEAASSLHVLLDILMLLWSLLLQQDETDNTQELSQWMRSKYAASFVRTFIDFSDDSFPYQQVPQTSKKAMKRAANNPTAGGEFCTPQNLTLVQLMCHFYPQPCSSKIAIYNRLLQYLQTCLQQLENLSSEQQLRLVAALRALLLDNRTVLNSSHATAACALLRDCMAAYVQQRYTTRDGVATKLLHLLCLIVQDTTLYSAYGGVAEFSVFLAYLPQLLLKPVVSDATLRAMTTLSKQLNSVFLETLAAQVGAIMAHIEELQVTGASEDDAFENKKRVFNLFYYARDSGDKSAMQAALQQLEQDSKDARLASYFKYILRA